MYYSVSVEAEALELLENAVLLLRVKEIFSTRLLFLSGNFIPFFFGKFLKKRINCEFEKRTSKIRFFQMVFIIFSSLFR